ncbi:MAG: hypothetical protein ACXU96_10410 [Gemmatimonadaceae bacterium]
MQHESLRSGDRIRGAICGVRRLCAAAIAIYVLGLAVPLFVPNAGAQISPGPLSNAHASLEGALNCVKCHGGGKESMTSRCLDCHREIRWLVDQNRGFHARTRQAACSSCHPDHAGRDFALVKWPEGSAAQFDHARAGWTLDGKHARVACAKCHTSELRVSPAASLGPKRTTAGWVGLEKNCASCHQDVHKGTLKGSCESCHNAVAWSPAPAFDHSRSSYPLTGKHVDVACTKCHVTTAGAEVKLALAQFTPLPHADCVSCHKDPHAGRLTGKCSSCHATTSFTSVGGKSFSHDQTRYPLLGRHASVSCKQCHAGYPARIDRPAFARCSSCHTDFHRGQATIAGAAADCSSCHSVSAFTPATFTVVQHARTRYPLVGKHATVSCASCHTRGVDARGVRDVVMRPAFNRCETCHAEAAHGTQLLARGSGAACTSCHTPVGWKPSTFGVREHATLKFALTGRHAVADCGSCHSANRRYLPPLPPVRTLGTARVALHLTESTCDACHNDPHGGKYTMAPAPAQGSCISCHDTRAFHPSTVDATAHARFAFGLEGAHRATPCVACHTTMRTVSLGAALKYGPSASKPVTYAISGATCASCHRSPHGTQFASRADAGACQSCHDFRGWAPASLFVHDANGGFTLGAAHGRLACARCHVQSADKTGVRKWRGVPRNCEACHTDGRRS